MGTFATTHAISYTGGSFVPPVQLTGFTITDGDTDTTFETGDTFFESGAGLTYQYEGTALVDGVDWPVFSFVGFPGTLAIFLDQVPVTVPGVDGQLLDPRATWADKAAYDAQAKKLVDMFAANFEQYLPFIDEDVKAVAIG
mgnify:CR=1 FL=1